MTSSLRALARLATRDVRGSRGRSALVVALIAVPVAALVGAMVAFSSIDPTPAQMATRSLGRADLAVFPARVEVQDKVLTAVARRLPAGARSEWVRRGSLSLTGAGARREVAVLGADLTRLGAGMVEVVEGRAPRAGRRSSEIALSPNLVDALGAGVGATVEAQAVGRLRVVAVVRDPLDLERPVAVVAPQTLAQAPTALYVALPPGSPPERVAAKLRGERASILTRAATARREPDEATGLLLPGGLAFVQAGLVASAAFAVSARRRQRDLGLIAAAGGHPGHLRAAVVLSGVVLGALGAGLGLLLGLGGAWVLRPWLVEWSGRVVDQLAIPQGPVAAAVVLGFLAAVASAWLPARAAARLPVLLALSGRRPSPRPSRRWLGFGGALVLLGVAAVMAAPRVLAKTHARGLIEVAQLAGSALVVVGFSATSPWLLDQLGRLAPRLPLSPRLALRDVARFRTRNGPVIAAVLASLAASVGLGATVSALQHNEARSYRPLLADDQLLVDGPAASQIADELRDALPVAAAAPLTRTELTPASRRGLDAPARPGPVVAVGDADLVRAIGAGEDAVSALQSGAVLVLQDAGDAGFTSPLGLATLRQTASIHRASLDPNPLALPDVVVRPETFRRLSGAPPRPDDHPAAWLVRLDRPVTDEHFAKARQIAAAFAHTTVEVEPGPPDTLVLERATLAISVVIALVIVSVALALGAAETRADQRILIAVGADPRLRRRMAAGRAALLAGLGAVLATPAGLLPVWGLARAATAGAARGLFVVPWDTLAVTLVGVPLVATFGAWILTRPASPWVRDHRRVV